MVASIAWIILWSACGLGLIGSLVPALPGIPLIAVGALIHKWLLPDVLSWWVVGGILAVMVFSLFLDWSFTAFFLKIAGSTKYGLIGALVGILLGFMAGGIGILIGPIVGAALAEIFFAERSVKSAIQSGIGAGVGALVSSLSRFFLTVIVIAAIGINSCATLVDSGENHPDTPPSESI